MLVAMSRRGSRHTNTRLGIKVATWTAATTSALPRLPSGDGVTDRMYGCRALEGMAEQEGRDGAHVSECRLVERHDNGELTRSSSRREMVSFIFRRKWFRSVALWGLISSFPPDS